MTDTIRGPFQERSRASMERMLAAAAEILETKNFDTLSVNEVVEKAGTSVGAFYGRFADKEALLQALDERFFSEFEEGIEELMEPSRWRERSLDFVVLDVTRFLVGTYGRNRGLLRSLNLKARLSGDERFRKRENRAWNELFPLLQRTFLERGNEIGHPDPRLATRLGFQQLFFGMREILLWEPLRGSQPYDPELLICELSRSFLSYLGVKTPSTWGSGRTGSGGAAAGSKKGGKRDE